MCSHRAVKFDDIVSNLITDPSGNCNSGCSLVVAIIESNQPSKSRELCALNVKSENTLTLPLYLQKV